MTYKLITEDELQQAIDALDSAIYCDMLHKTNREAATTLRAVMEREGPEIYDMQRNEIGEVITLYTLPDEPTT